uniref:Uncharacterized protein n=1 Tax=Pavo cristatus TaxID=9049 RepID=A0A8C9FGZ6_PAVCR
MLHFAYARNISYSDLKITILVQEAPAVFRNGGGNTNVKQLHRGPQVCAAALSRGPAARRAQRLADVFCVAQWWLCKMAAPAGLLLRRVLTPCRRWALSGLQQRPAAAPLSAAPPARFYAAAAKNAKRVSQKAKQEEAQKKKGRVRRLLLSKPVDDVYLTWYYERPSYNVEEAVGMLKKFQELDFTYPKQFVYINVTLDMQLQKKKKVDQFASIVLLPYRFTDETNKVLVFTEVSKPELLIYICHEPSMLLCQN